MTDVSTDNSATTGNTNSATTGNTSSGDQPVIESGTPGAGANPPATPAPQAPQLTAIEARVLGVLIEKERTVPDTYPLTLNALQAGCNQKTSREPVMSCSEADIQDALDALKRRSWVFENSGGRVMRYSQNAKRVLQIPSESVALLATLMLRGPQTVAELRINCERLCKFSDTSAVHAFLEELAARSAGALVTELARQPGARENRWMHLLCGAPDPALLVAAARPESASTSASVSDSDLATLRNRVQTLETEVAELRSALQSLCAQLGVGPSGN